MSTVKFIHSAMPGAPVLTGQVGSMIGVLDACLINGFGSATVDSIVISGGVATVTRGAGHPFGVSEIAQIAGATVTGGSINGDRVVLSANATQYTFAAVGIPNQTATGTITHRVAPLGWSKPFSGTNLAVYRSTDVTGTQEFLRVSDTGTLDARAIGYESMTDVNTGTGLFPTTGQFSGGVFWPKSNTADATARPWVVVGDLRGFYLWTDCRGPSAGVPIAGVTCTFGDFASRKSPDPFGCSISGMLGAAIVGARPEDIANSARSAAQGHWMTRGVSGLGVSATLVRQTSNDLSTTSSRYSGSGDSSSPNFPNPADNALLVSLMALSEPAPAQCFRGTLPGAYYVLNSVGAAVFGDRDIVTGVTGLAGRSLRAVRSPSGVMFFDVTGPWAR